MIEFACPRHQLQLVHELDELVCAAGDRYPIDSGIPILLDPAIEPTQEGYWATEAEVYPSEEREQPSGEQVDEYVRWLVRGTCGNLFEGDRLASYPIPRFPMSGDGLLVDIGANWGRWSIAAARDGFTAIALDPSLGAIRACRRVARQLGVNIEGVVGDARHLPFPDESVDAIFSYSVLQHLAPSAVEECIAECARVLRPGGISLHQLPNRLGLRNMYRQARRRFRPARGFEVRYWSHRELETLFARHIGPTALESDGFLTLNPHPGDSANLRPAARAVIGLSRTLIKAPGLSRIADSLWVRSVRS